MPKQHLDVMIAGFVDDVARVLQRDVEDQLRALLAEESRELKRRALSPDDLSPNDDAEHGSRPVASAQRPAWDNDEDDTLEAVAEPSEEITDPQRLLAAASLEEAEASPALHESPASNGSHDVRVTRQSLDASELASPSAPKAEPKAEARATQRATEPVAAAVDPEIEPVPDSSDSSADGPVSTVRDLPPPPPVRLRPHETLARVSAAGIVIRRAANRPPGGGAATSAANATNPPRGANGTDGARGPT